MGDQGTARTVLSLGQVHENSRRPGVGRTNQRWLRHLRTGSDGPENGYHTARGRRRRRSRADFRPDTLSIRSPSLVRAKWTPLNVPPASTLAARSALIWSRQSLGRSGMSRGVADIRTCSLMPPILHSKVAPLNTTSRGNKRRPGRPRHVQPPTGLNAREAPPRKNELQPPI